MTLKNLKVYLIAGEASGDNLGAKLMKQIRAKNANVDFYGIGGPKMQKQGMNLLFPSLEISIMGFVEVLKHLPRVMANNRKAIEDIVRVQPDVLVTIDSPGFCFRVAKAVKNKIKGKLIHYVAPTVWAYKPERAKKIAKIYDKLLTILPFEADYFTKEGLETVFVGYPPIEDIKKSAKEFFRYKNKLPNGNLLLCVAPGSRRQEIEKLLPIFLEAAELFASNLEKEVTIAIASSDGLDDLVKDITKGHDNILIVKEKEKYDLYSSADIAITKSGTITTELGLYGIPMVIAYKVNILSYFLIKLLIKVKFVSIINILSESMVIKELLQNDCNSKKIAEELMKLVKPQYREAQLRGVAKALEHLTLAKQKPSQIAAEEIVKIL